MSASWCKVASNLDSHPKIRKAGAMGREVFLFALRRNAEPHHTTPGLIPKDDFDAWYIADQLMRTEAEAAEGLARCIAARLLKDSGNHWEIAGWDVDEWGRDKSTGRVHKWRKKQNETFRNVSCVSPETDETDETARGEERRGEEIVEREPAAAPTKRTGKTKAKTTLPADWSPRSDEREKAVSAGLNCDREAEQFRDHHAAKGSRMADWDAAFRTWLRNAVKFAEERGRPTYAAQPQLRIVEEL